MRRLTLTAMMLALAACASSTASDSASPPTPPAKANDCHCDDKPGLTLKAHIVAVLADHGELRVVIGEIPGVLPAGTHDFKVEPAVLAAVQPGRDILARVEQRNGEWWLTDVRLLIPLPAVP